MAYRWDDLRDNRLEVEWGENLHIHGEGGGAIGRDHPRRRRLPLGLGEKKKNWVSLTIVVTSLLAAVGIAALVAMTLVEHPMMHKRTNGNPAKSEEMNTLPQVISTASPTLSPTVEPSAQPTTKPTVKPSASPIIAESFLPSSSPSESSSSIPSAVPKAPPAPEPTPLCVNEIGVYYNHAGDKVTCEWFASVGTYNYERNCGKTDLGNACLLSCKDYIDCILPTDSPSSEPSWAPSLPGTDTPTTSPTPSPPKSITIEATGDASVKQNAPSSNFGSSSWLNIDGASSAQGFTGSTSPVFHALLRFDLTRHDSNRPVESATLRLKAANSCASGGYLQRTHHPHWEESTIAWANAPEGDGVEIGRFGIIQKGFLYSMDVTSALRKGHETLSVRLYPASSEECIYVSRDNSSDGGPELHIAYSDV